VLFHRESPRSSGRCPRPTTSTRGSSRARVAPGVPPSSQATARFHRGLKSRGRGKDTIWRRWHGALLYMYCSYHAGIFPVFRIKMSTRNKLLNQRESRNGKSSRRLGGPGVVTDTAHSHCPWAPGHGDGAGCSCLPSMATARVSPSPEHLETNPSGAPQSNKALKYGRKSSREPSA